MTFTFSGFLRGARRTVPFALGDVAFSVLFGVLARQAGLSLLETLLITGLVFAGASQIAAVGLWAMPLPVLPIILTTFVVNLRHLLMGVTLQPFFSNLSRLKAYGSVFFMTDETWALTVEEFNAGGRDAAFLLGSGAMLWATGFVGTVIGFFAGAIIEEPARWGLDFIFVALFLTLLAGMWKGKSDFLPWATSALVAVAAQYWLPGNWYILLGALSGSLIGALRDES